MKRQRKAEKDESRVEDEIAKFETAPIDIESGEITVYNESVFTSIIRAKELALMTRTISAFAKDSIVLDYGCGSGWLSKILSNDGHILVGVDVNSKLIRAARAVAPLVEFIIADGEKLPFKNATINLVISISTLHHVDAKIGAKEIHRILSRKGLMLAMEPNLLNPLSAFGRKFFPLEVHTIGERAFIPHHFKRILAYSSFRIKDMRYWFFFSFPLVRTLRIIAHNIELHPSLISLLSNIENLISRIPIIRRLNSTIVVTAEKK